MKKEKTCEICGGLCHPKAKACCACACWVARQIEFAVRWSSLPYHVLGETSEETERNVVKYLEAEYVYGTDIRELPWM